MVDRAAKFSCIMPQRPCFHRARYSSFFKMFQSGSMIFASTMPLMNCRAFRNSGLRAFRPKLFASWVFQVPATPKAPKTHSKRRPRPACCRPELSR